MAVKNPIIKTVQERLDSIDKRISHGIYSHAQKLMPKIKSTLIALEWSCNGILWLSISILLILFNQEQSSMIPKLLIGLIVDIFYVATIKALARRRRPTYAYQRDQIIVASVDKHSFPSGHCSRSTYVSLFTSLYFHDSAIILLIVNAWTISVCVSRVLLGRHHIFDCIAGASLGWFNYTIQFHSPLPVNAIGMLIIRALFGSKAFNDTNDIDGMDAFQ